MLAKLRALMVAFMWGFLDRIGISEKVHRAARGETVSFQVDGLLTGRLNVPVNLRAQGLGHLVQPDATDRAQVGFQTVVAIVSVFVLGMVAVVVADNLDTSIGTPSNTALSTAQNDILVGFSDMASLLGTLFIIAIIVVIIFQIRRIQ